MVTRTPNKRKSQSENNGTAKKEKIADPKYWVFRMCNGEEELVQGKESANEYMQDNEDIIDQTFTFTKKEEATKHISDRKKALKQIKTTPIKKEKDLVLPQTALSPEERSKLDRITELIEDARPTNHIELIVKTNSRATKAVALVLFKNAFGNEQWFCKPDVISTSMSAFVTQWEQLDPVVQEALLNLEYGCKRDMSGDESAKKVVKWKSPTNSKDQREFELYQAYTHFTIPYELFQSMEEEHQYLLEVTKTIGETMKSIMVSAPFMACLENTIRNENFWKKMMGTHNDSKPNTLTYPQYINDCKIKSRFLKDVPNDKINTFLVKEDAQTLATILFESRLSTPKYETPVEKGNKNDNDKQKESQQEHNLDEADALIEAHADTGMTENKEDTEKPALGRGCRHKQVVTPHD